jgi:hypothetical protein
MNRKTVSIVSRSVAAGLALLGVLFFVVTGSAGGKECVRTNKSGYCAEYSDPTVVPLVLAVTFVVLAVVVFIGSNIYLRVTKPSV